MPSESIAPQNSLARTAGGATAISAGREPAAHGRPGADAPARAAGGLPAHAFDELRETLRPLRGSRIALLANRGNRGDGVIHLGGRTLLRSLGLSWTDYHETTVPEQLEADVLLVFGAGAFCRGTHSLIPVVQRCAAQVGRIIVLPSSFDLSCPAVRAFAASWDERYTVFCRERRSFAGLQTVARRAQRIGLAHDLAFLAELEPWARRPPAGTVGIFRRDAEAVFDWRPPDLAGRDISRGPDSEPHVLLDYVARHAVVHTDRTHAAITAAMMGREVWFYRNAYFKNEAIYEHSLVHWPRVRFVGRLPFSFRQFGRAVYFQYVQRNAYRLRGRYRRWRTSSRLPAGADRA